MEESVWVLVVLKTLDRSLPKNEARFQIVERMTTNIVGVTCPKLAFSFLEHL